MPNAECRMPNDAAVTGVHSHIRHSSSVIAHNRRLFAGVVSGIAHCGNCIGVPAIGGERMDAPFISIKLVDHPVIFHAQLVCVHALQFLMRKSVEPSCEVVQRAFNGLPHVFAGKPKNRASNFREQTMVASIPAQAPGL